MIKPRLQWVIRRHWRAARGCPKMNSEPDIELRRANVAEVPLTDVWQG